MTSRPERMTRHAFAAPLLATLLAMAGCWQQDAPQLLESGKAKMEKKEFKGAVIEFKNALQKDASLVEARFLLGKALLESGDPQGAWVELSKVRDAGYSNDELVPVMVTSLLMLGQADKFIAEYADVNLTTPKRQAELKATLAVAYGSKGKFVQARAAADAALQADPENVIAQLAVARLLMASDDRQGALAQVDRTIQAHPEAAQPWSLKAEILQGNGSPLTEVMAAYRQAARLQPSLLEAHLGIISLLWAQRDFEGVEKQMAELRKAQPGSLHLRYYSALLALERKDLKQARELSQDLLKIAPESPRFLHLAGMVEYERGGYVQAIAHLSKALPTTQAPVALRVLLARAQLRAGDPRKSIAAVQPLIDAPAAKLPSDVYAVAADAYLQIGDTEGARKMSALAVKANPKDVRSRTALALADIGEGRTEQGLNSLKSIATADAGAEAEVIMFMAHMRAGRFSDAQSVLESVERKLPDKAVAPYLRAQLALGQGKPDQARALLETALKRNPNYTPAISTLAVMDEGAGRLDLAVARLEKLVAASPDSVEALMALLIANSKAGMKPQELQSRLEAAIKRFPDAELPRLGLVRATLEQGDAKAALQLAQDGASRFPGSAGFPELIGRAELQLGNFNQAMQAFAKQAAQQPNSVEALMHIVDVHVARKDAPAAISQLRKVLAVRASHLPAHANLIVLLQQTGKADEALLQVKTLQAQAPMIPAGWVFEGDIQAAKRNFGPALAAYRTAQSKRPTSEAAVKLHRTLVAAGQPAEAAKLEVSWLAERPTDPAFNFYLGDEALAREDFERAELFYRKVLQSQPDDPVTLNNLAWLMHRASKPGALEFAEKALARAPNNPALLDTAAEIHAAAGRLDKALELQKRAVEIDPKQPTHRLHYAQFLIKLGQKAQAQAELQKLKELGKGFSGQEQVQKLLNSL